jgi:thiol-disulfide isomerase/thioredoxin
LNARPTIERRTEERTIQAIETPVPPEDVDHYSDDEDYAIDITPENFESLLKVHDLSLINFYAPWCHWSNKLKPVWEHTATFYKDNKRVLIGRCDCTKDENKGLCRDNHIMAFPTVRIYRLGATHSQEFYDRERQTSAFMEFINHELSQIRGTVVPKSGQAEEDVDDNLAPVRRSDNGLFRPANEDTSIGPEGCMLSGYVMVNRAPGNFHIQARAVGHSFNADNLNTTHYVNSLTFGLPLSAREKATLNSNISPFIDTLEQDYFVSHHFGVTREHYIKIVHTQFYKLGAKDGLSTYQYTSTDTEYLEHPPSAKFSFDLSPTQIVIKQTRQPLATFVTSVCAIIGGVFTVIGLVDSVLYHSLNVLKKQQMGKLG